MGGSWKSARMAPGGRRARVIDEARVDNGEDEAAHAAAELGARINAKFAVE